MVFLILYTFFFLPARIVIGFGGGSEDGATDWTDLWTLRSRLCAVVLHATCN